MVWYKNWVWRLGMVVAEFGIRGLEFVSGIVKNYKWIESFIFKCDERKKSKI